MYIQTCTHTHKDMLICIFTYVCVCVISGVMAFTGVLQLKAISKESNETHFFKKSRSHCDQKRVMIPDHSVFMFFRI